MNLIVECGYTECPYNCEGECGKDVLYINDLECKVLAESEVVVNANGNNQCADFM